MTAKCCRALKTSLWQASWCNCLQPLFYFVDESAPAALVVSSEKTKKQVFEIDVPL